MSVSVRLKEERQRLGLTQKKVAETAGISTRSQISYETGQVTKLPAQYLAAIAQLHIDVLYVMTGKRKGLNTVTIDATVDEVALVDCYRLLQDDDARAAVLQMVTAFTKK